MHVLYCRITKDTGIKLAEALGCSHGTEDPGTQDILIRWGNGMAIAHKARKTFNKKANIALAVNKLAAMAAFAENGVNCPELSEEVPCIGRTLEHTQGQGLWFCWEPRQIAEARAEGADYFVKYIPIVQEWRAHAAGGNFLFGSRKFAADRTSTCFMGVQGFSDTWTKQITPSIPQGVKNLAIAAVNALGLDFGGVDVVKGHNGRFYVLEVNTGPSLKSDETLSRYVEYFRSNMA